LAEFRKTAIERAFELAKSGTCQDTDEIKRHLATEGHLLSQITGGVLMRQLREAIRATSGDRFPR
jgi:hypothetical protein